MKKPVKPKSEHDARHQMIEELFYDFGRNRHQIYWMNFTRGIFFGFGTILGGTVLVAILVWILGQFSNWLPPLSDFLHQFTEIIKQTK
ncbi:MAG: hypothetical protein PWQ10_600 [Patescibacteria group bacterium]|nr:hypothetical protein [Patescibacteria group bacterium]